MPKAKEALFISGLMAAIALGLPVVLGVAFFLLGSVALALGEG